MSNFNKETEGDKIKLLYKEYRVICYDGKNEVEMNYITHCPDTKTYRFECPECKKVILIQKRCTGIDWGH